MIRILTVFWLIVYSARYLTRPWNFFQLNGKYFNSAKNIFSKLEINSHIPERWRLPEVVDDGSIVPDFPVFLKPEWGQNSHGVAAARNLIELNVLRRQQQKKFRGGVKFLLQNAASGKREYEIFYLREVHNLSQCAVLSLTETLNESGGDLVVNGINNPDSRYCHRTDELDETERHRLWAMVGAIGFFRIGRVGVRADSIQALLAGNFKVIEINIFIPMPLVLLDKGITWRRKHRFIRTSMDAAAKLAATQKRNTRRHPIFFRKLLAHYKVKG